MYHDEIAKELREEIQNGKGCIVFDFGCYFPYEDEENLTFRLSLGQEELPSQKLNHRYINANYQTISKKNGRRVSKIGYPYYVDLNDESMSMLLLCVEVGLREEVVRLIFPISLHLTEEKPVCGLVLHYNFEDSTFVFFTKYYDGKYINEIVYGNKTLEKQNVHLFSDPAQVSNHTLLYSEVMEPKACKLDNLWLN